MGGTAEVWCAVRDGRRAALKVLHPVAGESAAEELRTARRLVHAGIVRADDAFEARGLEVLVLELIDGKDLRRLLAAQHALGSRVPAAVACGVGQRVAAALAFAHRLGVVHRDVSPHNVMIARDGAVKLLDFGIATYRERVKRTAPGILKGKIGYLAPEVARGGEARPASDVFGLGVVLWEVLALARLFEGGSDEEVLARVEEARVPALSGRHPEVPEPLERLIAGMLARDADARPGLEEVRRGLAALAAPPEAIARWAAPLFGARKKTAALAREP